MDKKTGETVALKKIFDAFQNATDAQVCVVAVLLDVCRRSHRPAPLTTTAALQRTFREIMFLQDLNNHDNIIK